MPLCICRKRSKPCRFSWQRLRNRMSELCKENCIHSVAGIVGKSSPLHFHRMMQFASVFPDQKIVATLLRQFSLKLKNYFFLFIIASILAMQAFLKPSFSRVATPQIVVPFGEQTSSFKTAGCFPVSF